MDPLTLLVYFLVGIVVLAIIWYAMGVLDIPQPVRNIILLVAVLLLLLWLVRSAGLF
jgi:cytosine/uracil/thiamine/allantoin permease